MMGQICELWKWCFQDHFTTFTSKGNRKFIWIDADIYNTKFPNVFASLETAMSSLDRLKNPKTKKKVVVKIDI